ncbi:MAG TPA: CorA family divalent cation transporter [Gaiellaceae bacterium]|nr:CorA family divalent cation transporter [Gaiellaceae bacterium]
MATALLFERDEVGEVDDWAERIPRLRGTSILWIDLERPDEKEIRSLVDQLDLSEESAKQLADRECRPRLCDHGEYIQVTVCAVRDRRRRELERVECLVSKQWVVTVHDAPLEVLETFRERAAGSGDIGRLDGGMFLADVLEWVLAGYLDAFERIEEELDEVDTRAMQGKVQSTEGALEELVGVRREIGRVRRALSAHREVLLALTRPEINALVSPKDAERFSSLLERLEEAMQAARDGRESVVGSFDVLIASMGQRTNEIMKVLTLASVLLLPGALIAGILGMNFKVGLFEQAELFWVTIAVIAGIFLATVGVARAKSWI